MRALSVTAVKSYANIVLIFLVIATFQRNVGDFVVSMARIITIFVFVCLLFFFSCLSSELNKNHT